MFNDKYPRMVREEKLCYHPNFFSMVLAVRTGWKDEYGFVKWEPRVEYVQIPRSGVGVCIQDEERIDHLDSKRDVHSEQD